MRIYGGRVWLKCFFGRFSNMERFRFRYLEFLIRKEGLGDLFKL